MVLERLWRDGTVEFCGRYVSTGCDDFGGDVIKCDRDGFICEDGGFGRVLKNHATNDKLLSLSQGVVFVEFCVIYPFIHDIFGLEKRSCCRYEVW